MHQIPPKPDSFRVRVWRNLQRLGALQLKNSVYILPYGAENQKKFEGVIEDILSNKGDAFLCQSEFIQGIDRRQLVQDFNEDRDGRYKILAEELRQVQKILSAKNLSENDLMSVEHSIGKLDRQLQELKEIDFFKSRESAPTFKLLSSIMARIEGLRSERDPQVLQVKVRDYQGKIWVTRKDIHVDRVASAWLISRFIDKKPTFKFVSESHYRPKKNESRYDMFEGEFTHVGDRCTFEVLNESFNLRDPSLNAISEIIHDLDLKDSKFNRPETSGIGLVIRSIVKSESTDTGRMDKAFILLDDLYGSFA